MPLERHILRYAKLFELQVLHHFWLDDGATMFDALSAATREECLKGYDVRKLLEIEPTDATRELLEGLQAVSKPTSLGLVVALPATVSVPDASTFEFTLRIVGADFLAYSAHGLTVPGSADVHQTTTNRIFRYRSNAALYSNLTGCARVIGGTKQTFLSCEPAARQATDRIESIVNVGGALVQLQSDDPNDTTATLGPDVANLPAFATHADVPATAAIPDSVGTPPAKGILLPEGAPADTFALIRIATVHPGDADFSCTDAGGLPKAIAPVFELRFKNRRTLWRRFSKSAPNSLLSESGPFPLTYAGNPSTGQKPATRAVKLDRNGTAITNIVSEIFI